MAYWIDFLSRSDVDRASITQLIFSPADQIRQYYILSWTNGLRSFR